MTSWFYSGWWISCSKEHNNSNNWIFNLWWKKTDAQKLWLWEEFQGMLTLKVPFHVTMCARGEKAWRKNLMTTVELNFERTAQLRLIRIDMYLSATYCIFWPSALGEPWWLTVMYLSRVSGFQGDCRLYTVGHSYYQITVALESVLLWTTGGWLCQNGDAVLNCCATKWDETCASEVEEVFSEWRI